MRARPTPTLWLLTLLVAACRPIPDHGIELTYELPEIVQAGIPAKTRDLVNRRLQRVGGRGANASRRDGQILVRLPAGEALAEVKRAIAHRGHLWFRPMNDAATTSLAAFAPDPLASVRSLAAAAERLDPDASPLGLIDPGDLFAEPARPTRKLPIGVEIKQEQVLAGEAGRVAAWYLTAASEAELRRGMAAVSSSGELDGGGELLISRETSRDPRGGDRFRTYLVDRAGWNAGAHIEEVEVVEDSVLPGQHNLLLRFDAEGAEAFADLTEALTQRRMAIVLDGEVKSAPVVMERIGGGRAQLTLGAEASEADFAALAAALESGALPVPLRLRSERRYGPEQATP